jgi:hypothetical protein
MEAVCGEPVAEQVPAVAVAFTPGPVMVQEVVTFEPPHVSVVEPPATTRVGEALMVGAGLPEQELPTVTGEQSADALSRPSVTTRCGEYVPLAGYVVVNWFEGPVTPVIEAPGAVHE